MSWDFSSVKELWLGGFFFLIWDVEHVLSASSSHMESPYL